MKFFLDTAEVDKIKRFADLGLVDGITTNPTLIMKSGKEHKSVIQEIDKIIDGPISVEGIATNAEDIIKEAEEFINWGKNIVVKVPMSEEGIKAVKLLSKRGIKTNVTLVFSAAQALLVAKAGATYVSPFVGRLDDVSFDGIEIIAQIKQIYENYGFKTQILVASVRSPLHVIAAAELGAHVCTMPPEVLEKMFKHPFTDAGLEIFRKDWDKANKIKK
ncbi:MAG: fructose-6-phosphate aldolase [Candidatus Micrarchaeota archaeon]|nr:fructose-6-phosphate aldolase [Candidatus Micrarchaeota archaeon]